MDIYSIRKENLAHLIQTKFDGRQVQLAEKMDIKPPIISRWLSSTTKDGRNITEHSARAIESAAGLPSGWLDQKQTFNDQPEITFGVAEEPAPYLSPALEPKIKPIGIRSESIQSKPDFYYLRQFAIGASAGTGQVNYDIKEEAPFEISKAELIAQGINPETTYVIYVEGPSMTLPGHQNSMPDGSLIGFDRSKTKIISGKFYVVRIGDELLVKQVFQDQFTIQLRSLNPDFHPYDRVLNKSEGWQDVEILGQVKLMRPALTFF